MTSPTVTSVASTASVLMDAVRSVLSDDLLKPEWRKKPDRQPSTGHCYAAAEAIYHRLGGSRAGWTPMQMQHEGASHWYLRGPDGTFVDPTADQFATPPPHHLGTGRGFLTRAPSRRAAEILRRIDAI